LSKELGVTKECLKEAINAVGISAYAAQKYFGNNIGFQNENFLFRK